MNVDDIRLKPYGHIIERWYDKKHGHQKKKVTKPMKYFKCDECDKDVGDKCVNTLGRAGKVQLVQCIECAALDHQPQSKVG